MIKLIGLTKQYGGLRAVDNLHLDVAKGVLFGFLGPNGAGKTTTIRMMAGVLKPTSGTILIDGMDLARMPSEVKRSVGFIPDRPFLYEKLSGTEFLRFVGGLYGMRDPKPLQVRIGELLELFDLVPWGEELIESYSHGMRQRLIMCASLLHRPKLLIVDEPMVGLDPRGARLVKDIFVEEARKGTTVFMSTHTLETAEEVCSEIAIIQFGRVIASGTPEELRAVAGVGGNLESIFLKLTEGKAKTDAGPDSSSDT
jgi:ABC-2 type transport system ATP-binding protein